MKPDNANAQSLSAGNFLVLVYNAVMTLPLNQKNPDCSLILSFRNLPIFALKI
jgi:hypothetical protein